MTTVAQIDRLVIADDDVAARLWPHLGPRVRRAYTGDRDTWIAFRRDVDEGRTLSAATLATEHKVFAGWARAFRAVAQPRRRVVATAKPVTHTAAAATAAAAASTPSVPTAAPMPATPRLPAVTVPGSGAGTAVAGGLALAGLIALAARRKRT